MGWAAGERVHICETRKVHVSPAVPETHLRDQRMTAMTYVTRGDRLIMHKSLCQSSCFFGKPAMMADMSTVRDSAGCPVSGPIAGVICESESLLVTASRFVTATRARRATLSRRFQHPQSTAFPLHHTTSATRDVRLSPQGHSPA